MQIELAKMRSREYIKASNDPIWNTIYSSEDVDYYYAVKYANELKLTFFYMKFSYYILVFFTVYSSDYQAFITEACNFLFASYPDATKLCVCLLDDDHFGKSIFESAGFTTEVISVEFFRFKDQLYDVAIMSLFRETDDV
jgi:hypothetical protein